MFRIYLFSCPYPYDSNSKIADNKTDSSESGRPEKCLPGFEMFVLGNCIGCGLILMILSELYELCHDIKSYFTTGINIGWWLLIGAVGLSLLPAFEVGIMDWQYIVAAVRQN